MHINVHFVTDKFIYMDYFITLLLSILPFIHANYFHFFKLQKGCTLLATVSDKVYQLPVHGRWFSPGTPASSTTKTGHHDIAEVLLKVALKHQKSIFLLIFRRPFH